MTTALDDYALVEEDDFAGVRDRRQAMRTHDRGALGCDTRRARLNFGLGFVV